MIRSERISESMRLGTILTLSGGFLDAYSYMMRGKVFANAETGNIVMMGVNIAEGDWPRVLHYFIPVASFALGVAIAAMVERKVGNRMRIHWKESVLWMEIACVLLVGLMPQSLNMLANSMIAFICAMQVQTFRKVRGKAFATTMCTGNLRSGTELLTAGIFDGNKEKKHGSLHYYWIDFVFILGAAIGAGFCRLFSERAVWVCAALLLGALAFIMYQKRGAEV